MRRLSLSIFVCLIGLSLLAQVTQTEKTKRTWKTGGMLTIMGGQTGTRNWAPTGSEKFSFSAYGSLQLWAEKNWGKNSWSNNFDCSYGLLHTKSQGSRKVDDKLDFYSKYSYSLGEGIYVGMIGALRSQFTNGYDYTESPRKRISGFFAPAYLTLSPGMQLQSANKSFSFHFGPDVRWVIVTNEPYSLVYQGGIKPDGSTERSLADLYNVSPGKEVRVETGLYISALFKKEVIKNVIWKTRLDLNSDFRESHPFDIDVYWTNTIGMTVNKWLKVNYNFDLYHDEDVKMFGPAKNETRTQMKSMLGVGLGLSF